MKELVDHSETLIEKMNLRPYETSEENEKYLANLIPF